MLKDDLSLNLPNVSLKHYYAEDAYLLYQKMKPVEMEAWQLSLGQFTGTVSQIATDNIQLDLHLHNSIIRFEGVSPSNWGFSVPMRGNLLAFEQKYELEDNYIIMGPPQVGFVGVEKRPPATYLLTFSPDFLHNLCQTLHLPEPEILVAKANSCCRAVRCTAKQMKYLRQSCQELQQTFVNFVNNQEKLETLAVANWFKQKLEVEIAQQLLLIVAKAQNISPKKVVIRRATALKQAEEYMLSNLKSHITCQDICEAVGVSQRTLEYTFKSLYEITPKAYLKRLRLNHLRQNLLENPHPTRINNIAEELGFFHRGLLAQDYQQLFGELPSKTLIPNGGNLKNRGHNYYHG